MNHNKGNPMIRFFKDLLRFAWRRDSESAVILAISLQRWITWRDCRDLGAYYMASADVKDPTPFPPAFVGGTESKKPQP